MNWGSGYQRRTPFGKQLPPVVKKLLIANGVAYGLQWLFFLARWRSGPGDLTYLEEWFALRPVDAIEGLRVWQFVTHAFLHELFPPWHIVFNMLMLYFFGRPVEQTIGSRRFVRLYFGALIAGGLCMIPWYEARILGASGAVYGVLAMFARLYPDARVLVWGVLPVKARTLALCLVGLDLLMTVMGGEGTAHLAHAGGFAVGWFFFSLEGMLRRVERRQDVRREERDRRRAEEERRTLAAERRRIDELLAQVGRDGLGSLTEKERQFLRKASKRYRKN
jgi:membrane associated rhomboid family serine protease